MPTVRFHFDVVSPYSYLALARSAAFAAEHRIAWEPRPILYAALLTREGLVGPAETPIKRAYTIRDVVRAADRLGVPLAGPPAHPFDSLPALRAVCLHLEEPARAMDLAVRLTTAAWGEGRAVDDPDVVGDVVAAAGLDATDLEERLAEPAVKARLRALTDEAMAAGVFGVPTFVWRGERFWGHDRLDHLADRIAGRIDSPEARARTIEARPRGADRPGVAERFAR